MDLTGLRFDYYRLVGLVAIVCMVMVPGLVYSQEGSASQVGTDPLYHSPVYVYGFMEGGGTSWQDDGGGNRDFFDETGGAGVVGFGLAINQYVSVEVSSVEELSAEYDDGFNTGRVEYEDIFILRSRFYLPVSSFTRLYTEIGRFGYRSTTYENGLRISSREQARLTAGIGFQVQTGNGYSIRLGTEQLNAGDEQVTITKVGVTGYFESSL